MIVDVNVAPDGAASLISISRSHNVPANIKKTLIVETFNVREPRLQLLRRRVFLMRNIAKLECLALQRTSAHTTISRRSWMLERCNPLDTEHLFLPCENSSATEPEGALAKLKRKTAFALAGPGIGFLRSRF